MKFSGPASSRSGIPRPRRRGGATPVDVAARGKQEGIDVVVTGLPGRISGSVDQGSAEHPFPTTVVARILGPTALGGVVARTTTNAAGDYTLDNLEAPGTYELSFTATGYRATKVVTRVGGGKTRLQPRVVLGSGDGQISGIVKDGAQHSVGSPCPPPSRARPSRVITPTVGSVGAYTLGNLPTPGTYVVTFSKEGHGSLTEIVDLDAGESVPGRTTMLRAGTGTVTGVLKTSGPGDTKVGVGGAQVTVGGALVGGGTTALAGAPSTVTLTQGVKGAFSISGLSVPGSYTLTFTLPGYAPTIVPVDLSIEQPSSRITALVDSRLGSISGRVLAPGGGALGGAEVTATNGTDVVTTLSSTQGGALPKGGYLFSGLEPGFYAVTVRAAGRQQVTQLIEVTASGRSVSEPVTLVEDP